MNKNKYYILIGAPRHGKTTIGEELSKLTGNKIGSTSDKIYELYAEKNNLTVTEVRKLDKEQIRPDLALLGNAFCEHNPTALVDILLDKGVHIIDGIRRKKEFDTVCEKLKNKNMDFIVIWVSNPNKPIIKDNTEVTPEDADIIINNDSDIPSLHYKVKKLAV